MKAIIEDDKEVNAYDELSTMTDSLSAEALVSLIAYDVAFS